MAELKASPWASCPGDLRVALQRFAAHYESDLLCTLLMGARETDVAPMCAALCELETAG